eukprot:CAMPEP_0194278866 /NCGR_PEP_ID=MMETSP0169-20130528/12480_1 /TAXON_ID=218684 /ORGANISM="Corethron pennatum, Strain L29A3" /LENGTH=270 /DNA_ID=CAMNT_0039023167 /DNA_START=542 /DNA_END=1354 /DNA_ORIENTATION=-
MLAQHAISSCSSVQCPDFKHDDGLSSRITSTVTPSIVSDQGSYPDLSSLPNLDINQEQRSCFHLRKRKAPEQLEQTRVKSNVRRVMSRAKSFHSFACVHVVQEDYPDSSSEKENCTEDSDGLVSACVETASVSLSSFPISRSTPSSGTLSSDSPSFANSFVQGNQHLLATVSNSSNSEASLNRRSSQDLLLSKSKTKEIRNSYGWFVEMDEGDDSETIIDPYLRSKDEYSLSKNELAFKASTAPKRSKYDEDVAYAHAADTVDDVLGDFF